MVVQKVGKQMNQHVGDQVLECSVEKLRVVQKVGKQTNRYVGDQVLADFDSLEQVLGQKALVEVDQAVVSSQVTKGTVCQPHVSQPVIVVWEHVCDPWKTNQD